MKTVGEKFPPFSLQACVSREAGKEFSLLTNDSFSGKWAVLFFWPLDFSLVCPTEVASFGQANAEFQARNAQLIGASNDSHYVHLAWRNEHPELKNIPFPMLADNTRKLSQELGIIHPGADLCLRATFIVDPSGTIRHVAANDLPIGRNVEEVLRVLDALQTEKLIPCGWKPGEKTLN